MSKKDKALNEGIKHIGEWVCSSCASGSCQPAAIYKSLRHEGYNFEETSEGRWDKRLYCPICNKVTTHYKLLSAEPTSIKKKRCNISPSDRKRCLSVLGNRDAYTGTSVTGKVEIDHKIPFSVLKQDIKISELTDEEIKKHFQILTPNHNSLKEKKCKQCIKSGKRPKFFNSIFYYKGDENYKTHDDGSHPCVGCGYHDGIKWWEKYNNYTQYQNTLISSMKSFIKYQGEQYSDESDDE